MKDERGGVMPGVLFGASVIIWIYVMVEYRQILWMLLGSSLFVLVMTGVLITRLSVAWKSYQKKQTMLLDTRLTELQNQLLAASEESRESAQTNTHYTRKIGEALAGFEDELIDNQKQGNALMERIISAQVKSTKVLVKYNELNSNKVSNNIYNQYTQLEKILDKQTAGTNMELRKIGENIMMMQRAPQTVMYQSMPQAVAEMSASAMSGELDTPVMAEEKRDVLEADVPVTAEEKREEPAPDTTETEHAVLDEMAVSGDDSIPDELLDLAVVPELTPEEEQMKALHVADEEAVEPDALSMLMEAAEAPEPEVLQVEMPEDPNATLSPDQIAALFASVDTAPKQEEPEPEQTTPLQVEMPEDPNAKMTPDQIAALIASMNG